MKQKILSKLKGLSTLFTVLAMAGLLICIGGTPTNADDLNIAMYVQETEPTLDWDPAVESSIGQVVMNNVYETLLRYDFHEKKIIPVLATEYSKSADGMSWTFHIRKGVLFHDGSELGAEAVKFSIERTMRIGKGVSFIWGGGG